MIISAVSAVMLSGFICLIHILKFVNPQYVFYVFFHTCEEQQKSNSVMVTGRGAESFSLVFFCLLFSLPPFIEAYLIELLLPSSLSISLEFKSILFVHMHIFHFSLLFR